MARLFPLRSETPAREGRPRVVDLEDEDADAVFGALASDTARHIYVRLAEEPGTASDVADAIDSSIQNVRYHLEKLETAGLIEVVDTWYSSRGNEMSVYATTDGPLIVTSDESRASKLKEALSRYLGGVAVLAGTSLFVQSGADAFTPAAGGTAGTGASGDDGGDGGDGTGDTGGDGGGDDIGIAEHPDDGENVSTTDGDGGADSGDGGTGSDDGGTGGGDAAGGGDAGGSGPVDGDAGAGDGGPDGLLDAALDWFVETADAAASLLSPGMAFFLGGLLVLTAVTLWWYYAQRPYAA